MTEATKSLCTAAKNLPAPERLELAEELLESLDAADARLDAEWAKEAEDRLAAFRRGEIAAIPLEEVLARYVRR